MKKTICSSLLTGAVLLGMVPAACDHEKSRTLTVGVINAVPALKMARNAAAKLDVKLIPREVHDPETLNIAVLNIPAEADAVFLLPDSLMTANKRNLPTSAANINKVESDPILTSFGIDQHLYGKQTARLVDQIFKGARPADLPVEMAEFYLAVNLKVAKTIGLTISDDILRQAHLIVRQGSRKTLS